MTVDFATYCYSGDREKLYSNLIDHINSHNYQFDNIHLVHQRCLPLYDNLPFGYSGAQLIYHQIAQDDYTTILSNQGINPGIVTGKHL